MMDESGLLLDNRNPDYRSAALHQAGSGPDRPDLARFGHADRATRVRPQGLHGQDRDSLQLYADFNDFVTALTLELNGVNAARSMYARGHYNSDTNVFTAYKIFVYILEPR